MSVALVKSRDGFGLVGACRGRAGRESASARALREGFVGVELDGWLMSVRRRGLDGSLGEFWPGFNCYDGAMRNPL